MGFVQRFEWMGRGMIGLISATRRNAQKRALPSRKSMAQEQPGQFGVRLSDGMRIDRLPIGRAAGHWWLNFVFSGVDFRAGARPRSDRMWHELPDLLRLDGDRGRITLPPTAAGDGGMGADAFWAHYLFQADELRWLEISYLEDGSAVATETLDLV